MIDLTSQIFIDKICEVCVSTFSFFTCCDGTKPHCKNKHFPCVFIPQSFFMPFFGLAILASFVLACYTIAATELDMKNEYQETSLWIAMHI